MVTCTVCTLKNPTISKGLNNEQHGFFQLLNWKKLKGEEQVEQVSEDYFAFFMQHVLCRNPCCYSSVVQSLFWLWCNLCFGCGAISVLVVVQSLFWLWCNLCFDLQSLFWLLCNLCFDYGAIFVLVIFPCAAKRQNSLQAPPTQIRVMPTRGAENWANKPEHLPNER